MTDQDPRQDPRQDPGDAAGERPMSTADLAGAGQPAAAQQPAAPAGAASTGGDAGEGSQPLFPANEANDLRGRWNDIQTGFVDQPRRAVEDADALVATAMKRLAETFAAERSKLESQWDRGEDVSTEDLRVALQRYRTFFSRLLAV